MNRSTRGATLIEIVVVITIALVISAIAYPVLLNAKKAANITSSIAKLHHLHVATMIYQQNEGADMMYGDIGEMGLPPTHYLVFNRFGLPVSERRSSCGDHPSEQPVLMNILYVPGEGGEPWPSNVRRFKENMILYFDVNCSDPDKSLHNPYVSKLGLGVLLQGNIVKHRKAGDYYNPNWWAEPVP